MEERLRELLEQDDLTKAYNRRELYNVLNGLIEQYNKTGERFSLIMYDIDHFKKINDQHGHLIGDKILKELSQYIIDHKRSKDTLFRYGGEEFIITLGDTKLDGAKQLAKRFKEGISEVDFTDVSEMTVSMGVVEYHDNERPDDLLKRVDEFMYKAKEAGRDQIKFE
ncbi:MAG: GGDEF domain-containing protein [Candidatus Izemoplasma sp.]|nr:GGDEF domain-containing protein [Candidatus Izemoplasma sp.]